MLLGAVGDTGYNIVLFLHILTAMAALAPTFVHPLLGSQATALDESGRRTLAGFLAANGRRIYAPALIVTGLLGFALSGMSDSTYELSEPWLIAAIVVWIAMNGLLHAVVLPAERSWSEGDAAATSRAVTADGIMTALLVVMLYLMVFQPGQ